MSRAGRQPPAGLGRCSKHGEACLPDLALWLDFLSTRETRRENSRLASSRDRDAKRKMERDKTDSCPHLLSQPLLSDAGQGWAELHNYRPATPQRPPGLTAPALQDSLNCKPQRCLTEEHINKLWYIHTVDESLAKTRKYVLPDLRLGARLTQGDAGHWGPLAGNERVPQLRC